MNRDLILACGDAQHGDEGAALWIARSLRAEFCEPQTEIRVVRSWTPDLAEEILNSELVVFLSYSPLLSPGEIQLREIRGAAGMLSPSADEPEPEDLIGLAARLYQWAPARSFAMTIGGQSCEFPNRLSPAVRRAVPAALNQIKALLSGVSVPATPAQLKAAGCS